MVALNPYRKAAARYWPDWKKLLRTARTAGNALRLEPRHIYILPTRAGLVFTLLLGCMLIGSINYSLSLGFVLTFLLGSLGIIAMLHTWRNLAGLHLQAGRTAPVFAGQQARFQLAIADTGSRDRYAIALRDDDSGGVCTDVPAGDHAAVDLPVRTIRRGWLPLGRLTVHSEFPLGLFHTWSYAELSARCLVYPQPAAPGLPLPEAVAVSTSGLRGTAGDEDFSGLREHRAGDSPRRVDWKASARARHLLTKQFDGAAAGSLWLDWQTTPGSDNEARIAQLTRWVLDAHAAGATFGLRLPGQEIAPASGETHYLACLRALALYGMTA